MAEPCGVCAQPIPGRIITKAPKVEKGASRAEVLWIREAS